jgi:hypothetical protein
MPDELAAEKGAGSDAVSTLSNYLAIRVATDRIINVGTFTEGQKQFLKSNSSTTTASRFYCKLLNPFGSR